MPLPKPVLRLVGALSALLSLSAIAMCVASVAVAPHAVWVVFGFELIMAAAGVIGWLFARGRFADGQGLALLCVAGVTLGGGFLSYLATAGPGGIVFRSGASPTSMTPWFGFRVALGGFFLVMAAYSVLRRSRASLAFLRRGVIASVALGIVLAFLVLSRGVMAKAPDAVRGVVWALCAVVALVGIAGAGHNFIRAFECGRPDEPLPEAPPGA